jgi:hypothetical protein
VYVSTNGRGVLYADTSDTSGGSGGDGGGTTPPPTSAAGATVSFGFTGSWSGTNGKPAAFTLNGSACTVT